MDWSEEHQVQDTSPTVSMHFTVDLKRPDWHPASDLHFTHSPGPHLYTDIQQISGAVRSSRLLQMLHHYSIPKNPKITGLNDLALLRYCTWVHFSSICTLLRVDLFWVTFTFTSLHSKAFDLTFYFSTFHKMYRYSYNTSRAPRRRSGVWFRAVPIDDSFV